jgi:hypothetical protein
MLLACMRQFVERPGGCWHFGFPSLSILETCAQIELLYRHFG